tara:strand:+ start:2929 stop:3240 length:312 start_codon:yes stop_codon:yes gene_type:complete
MSNKKLLPVFDNDLLFVEKLRTAKKDALTYAITNPKGKDLSFSKIQFTKTQYDTEPLTEDLDPSAHLNYRHLDNHKPITASQRLSGRKELINSHKVSLSEIYN